MEISLATPLLTRDGYLNKDPLMINCYWETNLQGGRSVVRRPLLGPANYGNLNVVPVGPVQGAWTQDTSTYVIANDVATMILSNSAGSVALPGVTSPGLRMNSLVTYISSPGASIYYRTFFKSVSDAWYWYSDMGSPVKITDGDYPSVTTPGLAYLDGTYYVMDASGNIIGSDLENPASWNALNFVATDRGLGKGISIGRHLNYIVAFCEKGTQFFYDAANPAPGSPLSPVQNATSSVGCAHAHSIQAADDCTIFLSRDAKRGMGFHMIQGLSLRRISTPDIDRILEHNPIDEYTVQLAVAAIGVTPPPRTYVGYNQLYTSMVRADGHLFYIFTMLDRNLTLVYDVGNDHWAQWSSCTDGVTHKALDIAAVVPVGFANNVGTYVIPSVGGACYPLGAGDLVGSEQVLMGLRTRPLDAGTTVRKVCSELSLLGDTVAATMNIRYSNDYGQSWSAWRGVNLGLARKRLTRLGTFVARVYEFSCFTSARVRLESLVLPDRNLPAQAQPSGE